MIAVHAAIVLCLFFLIFSCGKEEGPVTSPPPPAQYDTLSAGWQKIKLDSNLRLTDIFFVNSQIGYVCGDLYLAKSVDGGKTWHKVNLPDSMTGFFPNLYFIDAINGWVVSDEFILKTTNGGSTWTKVRVLDHPKDIQFLNSQTGFLIGLNALYKSTDGGLKWSQVGPNINRPYGLFFLDEQLGWVNRETEILKTTNGGLNFDAKSVAIPEAMYFVQFTDAAHGWSSGREHWKTIDGGTNWEKLTIIGQGDVHYFDANNGFLSAGPNIYKTSDGGKTLSKLATVHESDLVEIHFTDPNHGWACGSNGGIYRYEKL